MELYWKDIIEFTFYASGASTWTVCREKSS
jgi:hypothetical protein